MKKIGVVTIALLLALSLVSFAFAGDDFAKCAGCHNGKVAKTKEDLLKKFKTADEFEKAAMATTNPMMAGVKKKPEDIKAAAASLGLK